MNLNITSRNFKLTSSTKGYATKKVSKLAKFLFDGAEATVVLSVEKHGYQAEVLINENGHQIQAVSKTSEINFAIDEVCEKMERQIKKYKEKISLKRKESIRDPEFAELEPRLEESDSDIDSEQIIEPEPLNMKPMTPEEAAMQLDILDRSFYAFVNSKSNEVNVIYKRKDNNFGLIEPVK